MWALNSRSKDLGGNERKTKRRSTEMTLRLRGQPLDQAGQVHKRHVGFAPYAPVSAVDVLCNHDQFGARILTSKRLHAFRRELIGRPFTFDRQGNPPTPRPDKIDFMS